MEPKEWFQHKKTTKANCFSISPPTQFLENFKNSSSCKLSYIDI